MGIRPEGEALMSYETAHEMVFSFLTTGPEYSLQVPSEMPAVPYLHSPIVSGGGARTFAFTPSPAAEEVAGRMAVEGTLLRELSDRDGRQVQLYRRAEDPPVWWLVWTLRSGCLTTHLREQDKGADLADAVVGSISVSDDRPTPFIFLFPPMRLGVSARPGYQEDAITLREEADGGAVRIIVVRPGYIPEGEVVADSTTGFARLRAGALDGLEVQVESTSGMDEARLIMDLALGSLAVG